MSTSLQTYTDFELIEVESYAQVRMAEHLEMDCEAGGEYRCSSCDADRATLRAVKAEIERREREGISIPDERVGMEALAPFGAEWEAEQRERHGF